MCTVTILPDVSSKNFIVTMNRDERHDRTPEKSPFFWENNNILSPEDPDSMGTWIAVDKEGDWAALLNGYVDQDHNSQKIFSSRGKIIPDFLQNKENFFKNFDPNNYRSFRFLRGNLTHNIFHEYFWDQQNLSYQKISINDGYMISSSSWEQEKVINDRYNNFKKWQSSGARSSKSGLPLFHIEGHEIPCPQSVFMTRSYAQTTSITQISLSNDNNISMLYWPRDQINKNPIKNKF